MYETNRNPVRDRVTLELATATATFLHGARPSGRPELRSPSIKSVVRWWYRAALGPMEADLCHPDHSPCGNCLRCQEAEVFGTAKTGPRVRFRVSDWRTNPEKESELNSKTGLRPHRKVEKDRVLRDSIPSGHHFTLLMDCFSLSSGMALLSTAAHAAWIAIHLGGFGQRSRRGAGSFVLKGGSDLDGGLPSPDRPADEVEFAGILAAEVPRQLEVIRRTLHPGLTRKSLGASQIPTHPSLLLERPDVCRIVVVPTSEHQEEAARAWVMRNLFKHPVWDFHTHRHPGQRISPSTARTFAKPPRSGYTFIRPTKDLPLSSPCCEQGVASEIAKPHH